METRKNDILTYLNRDFAGEYLLDEPLSLHTWYRIGGPADFFVYPYDTKDLTNLLHHCRELDIDTYFIGEGSNILVSDSGYLGVMICLSEHFRRIVLEDEYVKVDAGVLLNDLILFCEKNNLGGMECLSGVPGTVGGALIMNAGTHAGEIGKNVLEVDLLSHNLEPDIMPGEKIVFGYRSAPELQDKILLGCRIGLHYEKESLLKEFRINQINARAAKQPLEYPSCGSVFKRPKNHYVGNMVEKSGLKGFRYGNAMISEKHGGFILNLGNAKATEIMYLIEKVKDEIHKRFAVQLEHEVKFVGFCQLKDRIGCLVQENVL